VKNPYALCCLIIFTLVSCNPPEWTEFRGVKGRGRASASIQPPLVTKWQLQLQKPPTERRFFNQPLVEGNTLFFGSSDGNFYSLDIPSGYMNWTFRTNGPINAVGAIIGTRVFIGSGDGKVYCLNKETGELYWEFQTKGGVNSTLVPWKEGIMAASDADAFYYLNLQGELLFSLPNPTWIRNSFQIQDDILAFSPGSGEFTHHLSVYDLSEQETLWYLETGLGNYQWFSFPSIQGGDLHYSATGFDDAGWTYQFSSLDVRTGELRWRQTDRGQVGGEDPYRFSLDLFYEQTLLLDYAAPLIYKRQVIYAPGDQILRSFNRKTGDPLWKAAFSQPIATAPTLAGGLLYFGLRADPATGQGQLVCFHPQKERVLWTVPVEGTILNSPVIAGPWIIFGTDEGKFFILEEVF